LVMIGQSKNLVTAVRVGRKNTTISCPGISSAIRKNKTLLRVTR
jgi:hypothetical protein